MNLFLIFEFFFDILSKDKKNTFCIDFVKVLNPDVFKSLFIGNIKILNLLYRIQNLMENSKDYKIKANNRLPSARICKQ